MRENEINVSIDMVCMKTLRRLPHKVFDRVYEMVGKLNKDSTSKGLHVEPISNARDPAMRSIRVDGSYRAIGYKKGRDLLLLHIDEHDKAYRWALNRKVTIDNNLNRIIITHSEHVESDQNWDYATSHQSPSSDTQLSQRPLFEPYSDRELVSLGVQAEQVSRVRAYRSDEELEADQDSFDIRSYEALLTLAAGYDFDFALKQYLQVETEPTESKESRETLEFAEALRTVESRQQFYVPDNQAELLRFLDSEMREWRVFLHPQQYRIAYHKGYNGPALVRGGAGTGKTVVAMHRAKHLADEIAKDSQRTHDRVLFTTFTSTLANDVKQNLKTLCPEHIGGDNPIIEVFNLDNWVGKFLRQQDFERQIVYFDAERDKLEDIWDEVLSDSDLPFGLKNSFIKDEWSQIIQAKGITTERDYLFAKRKGRGTALDRRKRKEIWAVVQAYRARMIDEGLAEPDDAYREAIAILSRRRVRLPYKSVIVDEAQDMGEPALRLVRAIVQKQEPGDMNSLFIVGDAHQRIYSRKASMRECGIDVIGRAKRLRLNYRTSELTRLYAVSILEDVPVDDLDDSIDTLFGYRSLFKGIEPVRIGSQTETEEIELLVKWIKSKLKDESVEIHSIAVLVRANYLADRVKDTLDRLGIENLKLRNREPDDPNKPGIRIATMHRAKGLEFDYVAVALLSTDIIPPQKAIRGAVDEAAKRELIEREKSLLHVACTRARKELRISWNGSRPEIVNE